MCNALFSFVLFIKQKNSLLIKWSTKLQRNLSCLSLVVLSMFIQALRKHGKAYRQIALVYYVICVSR